MVCCTGRKKRSDIEIPKFIYNLPASCVSNLLGNSIESSANGKNVLEIKICKGGVCRGVFLLSKRCAQVKKGVKYLENCKCSNWPQNDVVYKENLKREGKLAKIEFSTGFLQGEGKVNALHIE